MKHTDIPIYKVLLGDLSRTSNSKKRGHLLFITTLQMQIRERGKEREEREREGRNGTNRV